MTTDAPPPTTPLRRLRLLGLFGPLAFVGVLFTIQPYVIAALGIRTGSLVLSSVLTISAGGFGWIMYRLIGRTHDTAVEAERQSAALVERDRIAREMHDSLAQVLCVAHLRLRSLQAQPAVAADPHTRAEVDDLATLCHEANRDVREAIVGLKAARDDDRTLLQHLEAFVGVFQRTSGIPTTLSSDRVSDLGLSPAAEVQVVRVIQEALTNVRKHAAAGLASVRLTAHDDHTEVVVEDDGGGFDPRRPCLPDGFGLTTMRERTESVGGTLAIHSSPGEGTRVVAVLPGGRGRPAGERVAELSA